MPTSSTPYGVDNNDYEKYLGPNYGGNLDITRTSTECHFGIWESNYIDPNGGNADDQGGSWASMYMGDLA